MSYENYEDAYAQITGSGIVLDKQLAFDGKVQRWKVDGEGHEKRGWTKLRGWTSPKTSRTYIVGGYGIWQGTDDGYTKIEFSSNSSSTPALSDEERAAIKAANKEAERKLAELRKTETKRAAAWAASVWNKCTPCLEHSYLRHKQIKPHGLRILPESVGEITLTGIDESNFFRLKSAAGALVVPMHNARGEVQGLQFIYAKGHPRRVKIERDKEFWPSGMAMGGTFGIIGAVRRDGIMLIAEGYATAASLSESTGQSAVYAFSANNLIKAGKELAKAYPSIRILFCADDDYLTDGNPGCTAAANACAEIERSAWIKPAFPLDANGQDIRAGKKLTDFNDLQVITGLPLTLADQINSKLDELNWRDAISRAGAQTRGGGGGDRRARDRPSAVSVMTLDDAVERFVPLDDGGGKALFDMWTKRMVHRDQMIAVLPAGAKADDIKRHPVWVERGAIYLDQVGFDPSGLETEIKLNTWNGWPLTPKRGSCEMLLELLNYLCSLEKNSEEIYNWLLCWMAYPLQNPGAKMASAIIMHGPQGTGKSTVFKALASVYGYKGRADKNYAIVIDQKALQSKFNPDWDSKLFVLAEEVTNNQDKWQIKNELKELVTGDTIRIESKFLNAIHQRNRINLAFLSNESQPIPLENGDRRHCVVWTPPELSQDYYDQVFAEMDAGGIEAFYDHLLQVDCSAFHPKKRPPDTQAKRNLIDLSRPSEERFILDWIDGSITLSDNAGALPFCPCGTQDLYTAYFRWCRVQGEMRPRPLNMFIGALAKRVGWESTFRDRYADSNMLNDKKRQRMIEPSILDTAEHIKRGGQSFERKDDETIAAWVTRCFFAFRHALGGDQ